MDLSPTARRVVAMTAIAKALVDAANDFGGGNQIAGDVWQLAEAAVRAVEPMLAKSSPAATADLEAAALAAVVRREQAAAWAAVPKELWPHDRHV